MADLQQGILYPLLEWICMDDTLMLAIRDNYINVYYRGGNIIKLEEAPQQHQYKASFEKKYAKFCPELLPKELPTKITSEADIAAWVESIPARKQAMDFWFRKNPKTEREFQQLVARENNYSPVSNGTEYFIADIEFTEADIWTRFDMLAFRWPAKERQSGKVQLALIEMKYADSALRGKSGVAEHFKQMSKYLSDNKNRTYLADMTTTQINQFNKLKLFKHRIGDAREFEVDDKHFEIIFIFASHNPRTEPLLNALNDLEELIRERVNKNFDVLFFVASTAGYAMHRACMMDINNYMNFVTANLQKKQAL